MNKNRGGHARAAVLSAKRRQEIARSGAQKRWEGHTPKSRKKQPLKLTAYASTGSHCGPWISGRDDVPGMKGRLAVFETYQQALADSNGPSFVHRVTLLIEQEPADESHETQTL